MKHIGLLFCILCIHFSAQAEYRVFVLKISKPSEDPTAPPDERLVTSNLDPEQYKGYYIVHADEKISYIRTWKCPGRTSDFKPFCPDPHPPPEP